MSTDFSKIVTPRGEARSMTPLAPTSVGVTYGDAGSSWFGPLAPMKPIAPPEVAGRSWDYATGYNLNSSPRAFEPMSFETLRVLADSYDVLRLVIERRKDQLCRLPWKLRPRGVKHSSKTLSAETIARIDAATELLRRPSFGRTWRGFIREYLEDLFVLDNASIFLRRNRSGDVIGMTVVDGSTIRPVIDDWGNMPEPVIFDGRPLPPHFEQFGYEVHNGIAWPVSHQQRLKGAPAVSYTSLSLISKCFNPRPGHAYGLSAVEQVAHTVAVATARSHSQLRYYDEANIPAGIYNLPESWSVDQVAQFQQWWDSLFVGNLGRRRQMRFVSGNGRYHAFHEPPLKAETDEWLARIIAFAFSYPVGSLVSLQNRAVAEQHERTAEEEGTGSLKQHIAEIFDEVIQVHLGHDDLEFSWIEEDEIDQEKQSKILSRYAEAGILTINQVLEKLGEEPSADPAASLNMVRTATGYVPLTGPAVTDGDAEKLAKGAAIIMTPPAGWNPVARFTLGQSTFLPNLAKGGQLIVPEDEAGVLEAAGWVRKSTKGVMK